jgi:hypothetical protein
MQKWEYRVVDSKEVQTDGIFKSKNRDAVEEYLNGLGAQGWEIVNLDFRELDGRFEFTGVAKRERRG